MPYNKVKTGTQTLRVRKNLEGRETMSL
uniref:Uncharacterized protein n=1 Tax=Rhizophora mucronata TaxID=61149 RepID=A0A2P2P4I8_RHIMU